MIILIDKYIDSEEVRQGQRVTSNYHVNYICFTFRHKRAFYMVVYAV